MTPSQPLSEPTRKTSSRRAQIFWSLFLLGCYFFSLSTAFGELVSEHPNGTAQSLGHDDGIRIIQGLSSAHTWLDTLKWWHGPWAMAEFPFFRPGVSTWWWLEYQLFGDRSYWPFLITSWIVHGAVTITAYSLIRRLGGRTLAVVATAFWLLEIPYWLGLPMIRYAIATWINDPDLFAALFLLLCCHCLLTFWRENRRPFAVAAFGFAFAAIIFKETGYIAAPLAVLLWCFERDRSRPSPYPILALWLLVAACFAYRVWALHGLGHQWGSNGSWLQRALMHNLGGRAAGALTGHFYVPLTLASTIYSILAWRRGKRRIAVLLLGIAVVCTYLTDSAAQYPFDTFYQLMNFWPADTATAYIDGAITMVILWLWWDYLKAPDRLRTFAAGWWLICYVPMLKGVVLWHALYLPSLGWSLFMAVAALNVAELWRANFSNVKRKPAPAFSS